MVWCIPSNSLAALLARAGQRGAPVLGDDVRDRYPRFDETNTRIRPIAWPDDRGSGAAWSCWSACSPIIPARSILRIRYPGARVGSALCLGTVAMLDGVDPDLAPRSLGRVAVRREARRLDEVLRRCLGGRLKPH